MNEIHKLEDQSNLFEAQIQDECIWIISKNQPFANHLRYIIAVLNSVKDLERIADYAVSAVRFFANNPISDEIRSIMSDALKASLNATQKIFKALKTRTALETYKVCQDAQTIFRKEYTTIISRLTTIITTRSGDQILKLFQGAIVILKHIERIVDHGVNISENFVFVKQSDFFFGKQSKQFNK
jgi:phosphate transport system protein